MMRCLVVILLAACGSASPPPPPPPFDPPPPIEATPAQPELARAIARQDFVVGESPMSMVVHRGTLVWSDSAGAIWTLPSDGTGEPRQLSDQKSPGFAFRLFVAGDRVLATSRKDLLAVTLPDGPVRRLGLTGLRDNPEEAAGSGRFAYLTIFKQNDLLRVPSDGGPVQRLGSFSRGVLGVHGETLYAASYANGELIAIVDGGRARKIASGFVRPTAVAADETHVFVYSERAKTVTRVEVATGTKAVIATNLENSDDLVSDGPWLYTFTWGARPALVRISKDGSRPQQVIADGLKSPYRIAVDAEAIYVTSRDQHKIIKLAKSELPAP